MKPSELARRRAQHIMVFGDPKVGKSSLVAELLMHGFKLHWVSMDNGHDILFKFPLSKETLDTLLNIIVIPDTKEFPVAISTCLKIISGAPTDICDAHGQAGCSTCKRNTAASWSKVCANELGGKEILVFDHIGQLANSAMNYILKDKPDEFKPEWEHYRVQGTLMDKFLTNVQQARYNVICITHTTETEMEDGKKKLVPLVGTVPFSRNVGKYFDHIVYLEVANASHKVGSATTYKNNVVTGSRSDVALEKLKAGEQPSLKSFFDGTILPAEEYATTAASTFIGAAYPVSSESEKVTKVLGDEEVKPLSAAMQKLLAIRQASEDKKGS